ncbi:MAG: DUF1573 domain-containing protein [candidate division Zixibacteria bacterium]|nr:DUF1573 domain-containing protein [candidate division Zixibacteria bacterium]
MKKVLITTLLFVGLLAVASANAAPRLTVPVSEFDFGYVPQNSNVSHTFWLHSTGDDTLRILNVKPG